MSERASQSSLPLVIAVLAGLLQVVAGIDLGRQSGEAVDRAAMGGALGPILAIAGVVASWLGAWLFGARPIVAGVVGLGGTAATIYVAWPFVTRLGFLYYGEFVLHHFLAILAAGLCVQLTHRWAIDEGLGRARSAPLLLTALGVVLLLGQHVSDVPGIAFQIDLLWQGGAAALLLAVGAAFALLWRALDGLRERVLAVAALVPLATRIVLGGGLGSAPLGAGAAAPMTVSFAVVALAIFFLLQPRIPWLGRGAAVAARALVILLSARATFVLGDLYQKAYLRYEDRLGGLLRSIVGFDLPYPVYVEGWRLGAASVAVFALLTGLVSALLGARTRQAALAIALVVVAGYGLTSPQLLLMHCAGLLALFTALADDEQGAPVEAVPVLPSQEIEEILVMVADRLELAPPVVARDSRELLVALRGDVRRLAVDLRGRSDGGPRWQVTLKVGVLGRGAPEAEVIPDPVGEHPRLRGDVQLAAGEGGGVLAALSAFPAASARLWSAGAEVDFGDDLGRLSPASLEALIRALVRQIRGPVG
ncbi:MAG: hypothetical protein R3B09_33695 [Nannocystaceae bacterium]